MKILILSDLTIPQKRLVCEMIDNISKYLYFKKHKVDNFTYSTFSKEKIDIEYKIYRFGIKDIKRFKKFYIRITLETINSLIIYLKLLFTKKKYDRVFTYTPSIFLSFASTIFFKNKNLTRILFLQDITLQNALSVGLTKRNKFLFKIIKKIENYVLTNQDIIITHTKENVDFVKQNFLINRNKIHIINNFSKLSINDEFKNYQNHRDKIKVVFIGNIGEFQFFPEMVKIFDILKMFKIHFYGEGSKKKELIDLIRINSIKNCSINKPINESELNKLLLGNVIGLVILSDKYDSGALPGKVTTFFSYGIPILSYSPKTHQLSMIIDKYKLGFKLRIDETSNNLEKKLNDRKLLENISKNTIKYFKANFDIKKNVNKILKISEIE